MSLSQPLGNLQKPQWFIRIENQKLRMNESVLSDLRGLGSHLEVNAVAGSLRTGKSWIISQLAGCDARNARAAAIELELKMKKDELEMEQRRQRYEHQLEKMKDEAISEIKTHERHDEEILIA